MAYSGARFLSWLAAIAVAGCVTAEPDVQASYKIEGDAISEPLASAVGDVTRGREVLLGRDGNCMLCHAVPETGVRFMGNLAPPLSGVGARLSAGQLRFRIVDSMRLNRDTIMPSYYRTDGFNRVAKGRRGKPILTAQQVEDTVAYLLTLR
jgi:sulfur-oxidizing protein SoxX